MKMRARIRAIAETPEYGTFRRLWQAFADESWRTPSNVGDLVLLGQRLVKDALRAKVAHIEATTHDKIVYDATAPRLIMEIQRSFDSALEKEAQELAAYMKWIEALLRERKAAGVRT